MSTKRAAVLLPLLLVVMAGVLRLVQLNHPERIFFDETYYVNDARAMLQNGVEEGFAVHPPLGKWLIAAGISWIGDSAWGWRLPGVIAGSLVVLLTYLIAVRLVRRRGVAALAGLLAAVDGLLFVQSRTAMLDVFLGFFVILGAWLLLLDFDRSRLGEEREGRKKRTASPHLPVEPVGLAIPAGGSSDARPFEDERDDPVPAGEPGVGVVIADREDSRGPQRLEELPVRGHTLRILAGAAFGLALATKWSGLLALAAGGLLALGWELTWRRRLTGRLLIGLGSLVRTLVLAFVIVPAVVYVTSYIPWFVNYAYTTEGAKVCTVDGQPQEPCDVAILSRIAGFYRYQASIASFHADLEAEHSYRAPAYTWPVIGRPVVYYWEHCPEERAKGIPTKNEQGQFEAPPPCAVAEENSAEIIALGNPGLWWVALAAVVPLVIGCWRDRRAWYIVTFWWLQFAPWLLVPRPSFFFYMVPIVPFLALANAYAITWLDEVGERRRATATVTGLLFAFVAVVTLILLTAPWYTSSPRPAFWSTGSLPWRLVPGTAFLFYMSPVVPFLALAIAYAIRWRTEVAARPRHSQLLTRMTPGAVTGAAMAVVAVALFIWFYPIYSGMELPYEEINQRWWFDAWI